MDVDDWSVVKKNELNLEKPVVISTRSNVDTDILIEFKEIVFFFFYITTSPLQLHVSYIIANPILNDY